MPASTQPTGGWTTKLRRARAARCLTSVLGAVAIVGLLATPARAELVVPEPTLPDVSLAGVTLSGRTVRESTAAAGTTVAAVTSPVVALPGNLVQVLGAVTTRDTAGPTRPFASPIAARTASARAAELGDARSVTTARESDRGVVESATTLLLIALAVALFLSFEPVLARRNPRLTTAPVDRREAELEFR